MRQDDGQRTGPEGLGKSLSSSVEPRQLSCITNIGDVDDQWIEFGSSFGTVDCVNGRVTVGARGKSVNRLCRHGDKATCTKDPGSFGNSCFIGRENKGLAGACHSLPL